MNVVGVVVDCLRPPPLSCLRTHEAAEKAIDIAVRHGCCVTNCREVDVRIVNATMGIVTVTVDLLLVFAFCCRRECLLP